MKIISCVDDDYGMMFNNRRQSRDSKIIEHVLKVINDKKIYMNSYSKQLFEDKNNIVIDDNFLEKAGENDYCFVENVEISNEKHEIDEIILYFWNRKYPSDKKWNINLEDYELEAEEDFEGSSHEKITQRIYIRRNKGWEKTIKQKRKLRNKVSQYCR